MEESKRCCKKEADRTQEFRVASSSNSQFLRLPYKTQSHNLKA